MVSPQQRRRILLVNCGCLLLIFAGVTALNLVLPAIALDLALSQTAVHWIADGYAVALAALLLPAGALGDRFGRRPALLVGLVVFALCSGASAFMTGGGAIILLRIGAGAGAALAMPVTLSTITSVYPDDERQQAVTVWAATAAAGGLSGFFVTSSTLDRWGWGATFVVLAVGAVALALAAAFVIPDTADPAHAATDPLGTVTSVLAVGWLVFAVIEAPERGWTSAATVGALAASVTAATTWVAVERRTAHPMLDPDIFRRGPIAAATASLTVQYFTTFGILYATVQYFLLVLGDDTLAVGLRFAPMAVGVASSVVTIGPIVDGLGRARAGALGLGIAALALGLFAAEGDSGDLPVAVSFVGFGAGLGVASATATSTIVDGFTTARQGVASALNDTARELGAAIGIAVLGAALNAGYRGGMDDIVTLMPPDVAELALDSPAAAFAIADQAGAQAAPLAATAADAIAAGTSLAAALGAAATMVVALLLCRQATRAQSAASAATAGHERAPTDGEADSTTRTLEVIR